MHVHRHIRIDVLHACNRRADRAIRSRSVSFIIFHWIEIGRYQDITVAPGYRLSLDWRLIVELKELKMLRDNRMIIEIPII